MANTLEKAQRHNTPTEGLDWSHPLLTIRCIVYNHEAYIRDCLEGFVMQETTFPFEVIIHDDASTDNSVAIIKEYAAKYQHIIKPIIQTENQYQKPGHGHMNTDINNAMAESSRYLAFCEGDDYWIDPTKIQQQVEWFETHPDYTMVWHDSYILDYRNGSKTTFHRANKNTTIGLKEIIMGGGGFCPSPSLMVHKNLYLNRPKEVTDQFVGDYPDQIYFALMGKTYYIAKPMSVYRLCTPGSWTSTARYNEVDGFFQNLKGVQKILQDLNRWSNFKYDKWFQSKFYRDLYRYYSLIPNYKKMKEYYWKANTSRIKSIPTFYWTIRAYFSICIRTINFLQKKQSILR